MNVASMNTYQDSPNPEDEKPSWVKRILIALVIIGVLFGLWQGVKGLFNGHAPEKKSPTKVKIMLPDTPPPPPPPPKEPPKETPKDQPKEMKQEPPKPQETPQPPAEALKMEGAAGDGPSPFTAGAVNNDYKGGEVATKIGGKPNPNQFAWYTGQIKTALEDALSKNEKLKQKTYVGVIKVWIAKSGLIERVELVNATGNAEVDEAIKQSVKETGKLAESPPDDMPQPVKLRLTSR